ncbi:MAG: hypothetical protein IJB02_04945 [Oscillospiraceae bacterium]|nr:hypothetical protein [Oscillospiraceae bacterium]
MESQNFSMEDAMRLIQSPAGQQLMKLLQSSDDPALHTAMDQANQGNMESAKDAIRKLAESEQIRKLISQLGG